MLTALLLLLADDTLAQSFSFFLLLSSFFFLLHPPLLLFFIFGFFYCGMLPGTADPACACFDYYEHDDAGDRCGAPAGCASLKPDASTIATDKSNTLYVKDAAAGGGGEVVADGIAYSSMSTFGRDVTEELVTAARKGTAETLPHRYLI